MRIRKRFPPPSSSNLSDPQLNNSSLLVQHQQEEQVHFPLATQQDKTNSQPSDPPIHAQHKMVLTNNKNEFGEIKSTSESRKEGIQCGVGEAANSEVKIPSSSHQVFGGWFGDRAIPIKKRRGSLGKRASEESMAKIDEEKKMATMTSRTNKKCVQENGGDEQVLHQEAGKECTSLSKDKEGLDIDLNTAIVSDDVHEIKKNVKRGSVIMEGSRCSRVNGRGWRCCQQTLVGYSLCEHHLGKGRLRSMNNARNRAKSKKGSTEVIDQAKTPRVVQQEKKKEIVSIEQHDNEEEEDVDVDHDDEDYNEDDGDDLVMRRRKKKKKKIGMVKARSISSLLGLGQEQGEGEGHEIIVDEDKSLVLLFHVIRFVQPCVVVQVQKY